MYSLNENDFVQPTEGAITYRHYDIHVRDDALYIIRRLGMKTFPLVCDDSWCQLIQKNEQGTSTIHFTYPYCGQPRFSNGPRITRIQIGQKQNDIFIDIDGQPLSREKIVAFIFYAFAEGKLFIATINPALEKYGWPQTVLVSRGKRYVPTFYALLFRLYPAFFKG